MLLMPLFGTIAGPNPVSRGAEEAVLCSEPEEEEKLPEGTGSITPCSIEQFCKRVEARCERRELVIFWKERGKKSRMEFVFFLFLRVLVGL